MTSFWNAGNPALNQPRFSRKRGDSAMQPGNSALTTMPSDENRLCISLIIRTLQTLESLYACHGSRGRRKRTREITPQDVLYVHGVYATIAVASPAWFWLYSQKCHPLKENIPFTSSRFRPRAASNPLDRGRSNDNGSNHRGGARVLTGPLMPRLSHKPRDLSMLSHIGARKTREQRRPI